MDFTNNKMQWESGFEIKAIVESVKELKMQYHFDMELLLILDGSVILEINDKNYTLSKNDLFFINANEIYTIEKISRDNLVLFLRVNPSFFFGSDIDFKNIQLNNAVNYDENNYFILARQTKELTAKIVLNLNDENNEYSFKLGSDIYLLGETIIDLFKYKETRNTDMLSYSNISRVQRIIDYIVKNAYRKLTLKELSEKENLNYFYLSHFIKRNLGVSFKQLLNIIRLDKAVRLIIYTDEQITDISNTSGFRNITSFNKLFKEEFEMTPTEYREHYKSLNKTKSIDTNTVKDKTKSEVILMLKNYLGNQIESFENETISELKQVSVSYNKAGKKYSQHWKRLVTFGCAKEGLKYSWQRQFEQLQNEIGFEYVKFHGVFAEDMQTFKIVEDGSITYNWTYIDEVIDSILRNNAKPYIELSLLPYQIKQLDKNKNLHVIPFSYLKHTNLWKTLVKSFIEHCIDRYGIGEVNNWYFELWEIPKTIYEDEDISNEDLLSFYKQSVQLIKSISKEIKVGGPSVSDWSISSASWFSEYLEFVEKKDMAIDFISIYAFSQKLPNIEAIQKFEMRKDRINYNEYHESTRSRYHEEPHLTYVLSTLQDAKRELFKKEIEINVTNWGMSAFPDNLISDTAHQATYIIKNMLDTIGLSNSIGYWSFTDLTEVFTLNNSHFHGGLGLLNKDGIKKASYNAFYLLSKLGDKIITIEENYIVTKKNQDIQVLIYNHAKFDELFAKGDISRISKEDRYSVFKNKNNLNLEIIIDNIQGQFKLISYKLNRENGSSFDEWVKLGLPENMNLDQINYLKSKDSPKQSIDYLNIDEKFIKNVNIPPHGAKLLILKKRK